MQELSEETIGDVLGSLQYATEAATGWAKAWHNWALFNVQVGRSFWVGTFTSQRRWALFNVQVGLSFWVGTFTSQRRCKIAKNAQLKTRLSLSSSASQACNLGARFTSAKSVVA